MEGGRKRGGGGAFGGNAMQVAEREKERSLCSQTIGRVHLVHFCSAPSSQT